MSISVNDDSEVTLEIKEDNNLFCLELQSDTKINLLFKTIRVLRSMLIIPYYAKSILSCAILIVECVEYPRVLVILKY